MISFRLCTLLLALFGALPVFATNSPLAEDFELTGGDFTPSSTTSWKWGVPVAGPGSAHSGTQAWGTNLTSDSYSSSEDAILTSKSYDLSAFAGKAIVVHWWQWLVSEEGFDQGRVEVSRDGGGTWEAILGPRSGVVDPVWTQHTAVLDSSYATATFQLRFRLISDDFPSPGGFFIDDLRLSAAALTVASPLQDFELSNGGYVAGGTNSSWAWGAPVSAPGAAYSGSKAWATNLDGFYNANEDSSLTSPVLDLSASAGQLLIVSWRQFFDTEEQYDLGSVEVSKDSGGTWQAVSAGEMLSGVISAPGWMRRQAFVDASFATTGFRLRFRLTADDTQQFDGWAIDDVAIFATAALLPTSGSFTKSLPQNFVASFTQADFLSHFSDPDGGGLTGIVVDTLPANGTLKLGAVDVVAGQNIPLSALAGLSYVPLADASGVETFQWSASNFFGSSVAGTVTLNILAPTPLVVIAIDPQPQTVNPGSPVTFSVTAVSTLPLSYQWRKNLDPIGSATGSTFTIASAGESDEDSYDVVVSNANDSVTSAAAILSVNDPVQFVQQPASVSIKEEENVTFAVSAMGTGRLDYQWLKNDQPIPDATFSSLSIVKATASDDAAYRCRVTNVVGSKTTDPAHLTVQLKPRFVVHPISRGGVVNGRVIFSVQVEGFGPFTYQWIKDGAVIPGANSPTLVINSLLKTNAGNYSVRVGNSVASAESHPARLQVFLWTEVSGSYQDVVEQRTPLVVNDNPFPGHLAVALTRGRSFTAVVQYRGLYYRFLGVFDTELKARKVIARPLQSPLTVELLLDPSTLTISASVKHDDAGVAFLSEALLPHHNYTAKKNPAPQKGRYTVLLEPAGDVALGYLFATVTVDGRMALIGKLPDGSRFSAGTLVQSTSRAAVYQRLYGGRFPTAGELSGRITLPTSEAEAEVGGGLVWRKPAQKIAGALPGPFVVNVDPMGSRYVVPAVNKTVIDLPQDRDLLDLRISGLAPGGELQRWVHLTSKNQFSADPSTAEKIGFTLLKTTGGITGTYTDPVTKKKYPFVGVSLQAQKMFGGLLIHETTPAAFTMVPLVQ